MNAESIEKEAEEENETTGVIRIEQNFKQQQQQSRVLSDSELPFRKKIVNFSDENTKIKNSQLGSLELDYKILSSQLVGTTASVLSTSSDTEQIQFKNNNKIQFNRAELEQFENQENENPLLTETSSNESLNQIIKIKKIDINKIEDIYKESSNNLYDKTNFTESSNQFNATTNLINKSSNYDYIENKNFKDIKIDSFLSDTINDKQIKFDSLSESNSSKSFNSKQQIDESNKTRLTYPVLPATKLVQQQNFNSTSSSQFQRSSNETKTAESQQQNVFHPTWDEWKRSHSLNKSNESQSKIDAYLQNYKQTEETTKTNKSIIEETYKKSNNMATITTKNFQETYKQTPQPSVPQYLKLNNKTEIKQQTQRLSNRITEDEFTYHPPAPIIHNDGPSVSPTKQGNRSPTKSPKHYPVYPIDRLPQRASSPVRLSSVVLAKTEKIEPIEPKPQPEPPLIEIPQPKKIKTILTTQKRKDSAPNLTGWRDYDSDTDTQSRLLAKASGSIPIEYISIRRDPKPSEKKKSPVKKSITTGTNTNVDYGKRIASTNTNQDEIPQYNLHVSLDSLFVKSRREASTSTERVIKNAATETEIKQRDAFTLTDDEEPPAPPPPPTVPPVEQQYIYKSRKSRYSEWESVANQPEFHEDSYRLEFLTISPRTLRRNNYISQQVSQQENFTNIANRFEDSTTETRAVYPEVIADDDDKIIFGNVVGSNFHHEQHNHYSKRSGSFPSLRPIVPEVYSQPVTRRYIKHTSTSYGTPVPPNAELGLMPIRVSNSYLNKESISQNMNSLSSKFNEVFGQQQQEKSINDYFSTQSLQRFERTPVKTERYYKYSKIEQVPSFGEIYHRNVASQASNSSQYRSSSNNYYTAPIIEMPATPDSTLRPSSRQAYSTNNSVIGGASGILTNANAAHSSGYSSFSQKSTTTGIGGPLITPINDNNNWFTSSCSSSVQQGFEPIIKQNEAYSSSVKNSGQQRVVKGSNREEEEEIFSSGNEEADHQFRPIFQPILDQTDIKRKKFSTSSYEYIDGGSQTKAQQWPNSSRN